jgi:hypothetical protein
LALLTLVLAQQIVDLLFPDETSVRIIGKMVLDTALIATGLGLRHKIVANAILFAGIARFIFVFFQLKGMDPTIRVIVIIIILIVLFAAGFVKFGKSFVQTQPKEVK